MHLNAATLLELGGDPCSNHGRGVVIRTEMFEHRFTSFPAREPLRGRGRKNIAL